MGVLVWIEETEGAVTVLVALGLNFLMLLAATAAMATGTWMGQSIRWRTRVDLVSHTAEDPNTMLSALESDSDDD